MQEEAGVTGRERRRGALIGRHRAPDAPGMEPLTPLAPVRKCSVERSDAHNVQFRGVKKKSFPSPENQASPEYFLPFTMAASTSKKLLST